MTHDRRALLDRWMEHKGFPFLDPDEIRSTDRPVHLETGFGLGEHLLHQAALHPDSLVVGSEVFQDGVVHVLEQVAARPLPNIRLWPRDVRPLLDQWPEATVSTLWILFPDPWPKKRHWKRRMIHPLAMPRLARVMRNGGMLKLATDHEEYLAFMRETLAITPGFVAAGEAVVAPGASLPADMCLTRYARKALAQGRKCSYIDYRYFRDSGSVSLSGSGPCEQRV
jgi:tRNA (guanine-N7-)-methyltransferase